jgi:hypothetical protein
MNTQTQPTDEELHVAWTDAIYAENIYGARAESLQQLKALRDRRTTWVGSKEWELRCAIDNYLEHHGYGFRASLCEAVS